jgi:hypothetical protein
MTGKLTLAAVPQGRVDIGALAGSLTREAASMIAAALVRGFDSLEAAAEHGRTGVELNKAQKVELVQTALEEFACYELRVARQLKEALELEGVTTWGLPEALEKALG